MVKFLDTRGIGSEIFSLIRNARKRIILMCPNLTIPDDLHRILVDATKYRELELHLVYGKELVLDDYERAKLAQYRNLKLHFSEDCHAKLYANESVAVLCSMNLHDLSTRDNEEMGVLISRGSDANAVYNEIVDNAERIIRCTGQFTLQQAEKFVRPSDIIGLQKTALVHKDKDCCVHHHTISVPETSTCDRLSPAPGSPTNGATGWLVETTHAITHRCIAHNVEGFCSKCKAQGYEGACVRCGTDIDYDPSRPLCCDCYRLWIVHENSEMIERFCHRCGQEQSNSLSVARPLCKLCAQ